MNKKQTILLAVIVLLIGGGVWALRDKMIRPIAEEQRQNTIQPFAFADTANINASDWKTYTNSKHGFEFKYPPGAPFGVVGLSGELVDSSTVSIPDDRDQIKVFDETEDGSPGTDFSVAEVSQFLEKEGISNVKDFAEFGHQSYSEDNEYPDKNGRVSELKELEIPGGDNPARYFMIERFPLTGNESAKAWNKGTTFVYVSNDNKVFEINFDHTNPIQTKMFQTFQFYR